MDTGCSSTTTTTTFTAEQSVAGNSEALQALRELITYPFLYSKQAQKLGLKWPCGLLLYGPPGTGKTSLVRAVVRECDAHLIVLSPHSVHRAHAGESEKVLRDAFAEASSHIKLGKPSVIFIDEIDAICPQALCREAAMCAVKRCSNANEEDDGFSLLMEDWKFARSIVGPSITRGVTVEIPKVSWDDIGGLNDLKVC
nr:cell division control protein 48 homolog B-like [Tanacetum cinerariifolium]